MNPAQSASLTDAIDMNPYFMRQDLSASASRVSKGILYVLCHGYSRNSDSSSWCVHQQPPTIHMSWIQKNDYLSHFSEANMIIDRHSRRKPFTNWVKRLANLKNSSGSGPNATNKRSNSSPTGKHKKMNAKNNPYPASGKQYLDIPVPPSANGHLSFNTPPSGHSMSYGSPNQSKTSIPASSEGQPAPTIGNKSMAPTISTNPETVNSDTTQSKTGTAPTIGGGLSSSGVGGGEGSTFSSPAPSERSMTTTLTTMQSAAPSQLLAAPNHQGHQGQSNGAGHMHEASNATQFQHQFPTSPVSAIPPYLNHHGHHIGAPHPTTYQSATANNLLTDNASVMTLASSSKRRRRHSLDTNASVRALAPSSVYGGSKESLPLSVLSAPNDQSSTTGHYPGRQVSVSLANAERASVYSSSGIAPALPSERNSYYATKQPTQGDGASVRSGLMGHARQDSLARSISGMPTTESPLNSPREVSIYDRLSRRNSGKTETLHTDDDDQSLTK